jgi:Ankyrin repeat
MPSDLASGPPCHCICFLTAVDKNNYPFAKGMVTPPLGGSNNNPDTLFNPECGCNPLGNKDFWDGGTALHRAVRHDSSDMVGLLLGLGVDISALNNTGKSALHLAESLAIREPAADERRGRTQYDYTILKQLLEHAGESAPAAITALDPEGWTILHRLIQNFPPDIADNNSRADALACLAWILEKGEQTQIFRNQRADDSSPGISDTAALKLAFDAYIGNTENASVLFYLLAMYTGGPELRQLLMSRKDSDADDEQALTDALTRLAREIDGEAEINISVPLLAPAAQIWMNYKAAEKENAAKEEHERKNLYIILLEQMGLDDASPARGHLKKLEAKILATEHLIAAIAAFEGTIDNITGKTARDLLFPSGQVPSSLKRAAAWKAFKTNIPPLIPFTLLASAATYGLIALVGVSAISGGDIFGMVILYLMAILLAWAFTYVPYICCYRGGSNAYESATSYSKRLEHQFKTTAINDVAMDAQTDEENPADHLNVQNIIASLENVVKKLASTCEHVNTLQTHIATLQHADLNVATLKATLDKIKQILVQITPETDVDVSHIFSTKAADDHDPDCADTAAPLVDALLWSRKPAAASGPAAAASNTGQFAPGGQQTPPDEGTPLLATVTGHQSP